MIISHDGISLNSRLMTMHNDPCHGWLKVDKSLLRQLDIADRISAYSYMKDNDAYLEEDCDMTLFIQALLDYGFEKETVQKFINNIEDKNTNHSSRIRNYDSYSVGN